MYKSRLITLTIITLSLTLALSHTPVHATAIETSTNKITSLSVSNRKTTSTLDLIVDWFKKL
ncbi:hypothetical protein EQG49_01120 [Periweissella cryptocerci]|uniref:Uncharacterized protein n=1 Tax=Periweissella cryptocerci TaxID=2506420 RepID=A0A4P6YRB4_9LACO|nr:hypothetical protein [Periweissella cryptocerci]QBO35151.1 hypothetical protein EQG49_01120 [Periweissella cryptocerci]